MNIKEFKEHLANELRDKKKDPNSPTPIWDRLAFHLRDYPEFSVEDLLQPEKFKSDLFVSFLLQVCYPSRIKMPFVAEYESNRKKKVAIISCKSRKKDYICSADVMYGDSHLYQAQRNFCVKGYDEYYIVSSKYGITHPSQIIEPYNITLSKSQHTLSENNKNLSTWDPQVLSNVHNQLEWMIEQGWDVDFHTSRAYYEPLEDYIKSQINYIKQPRGINSVKPIYDEATKMLDNSSLEESLKFITKKRESTNKETPKWFYHPEHGKFYGKTRDVITNYSHLALDEANLACVSRGKNPQSCGWVIDESLLDKLYQTDSGKWRLKK